MKNLSQQYKWHMRYLAMADLVSSWSKDESTKVGAVIVDHRNYVLSLGYNGAPAGVNEPDQDNREQRLARTIHAEENALLYAKRDLTGATLYCTHMPCSHCAALIIQSGIKKIVHKVSPDYAEYKQRWEKSIAEAHDMFREAGVEIYKFSLKSVKST